MTGQRIWPTNKRDRTVLFIGQTASLRIPGLITSSRAEEGEKSGGDQDQDHFSDLHHVWAWQLSFGPRPRKAGAPRESWGRRIGQHVMVLALLALRSDRSHRGSLWLITQIANINHIIMLWVPSGLRSPPRDLGQLQCVCIAV
jgi:hypothetical protein